MRLEEVQTRWRELDPVFVRGMQRSGTSAMGRALQQMGIVGFGEGHLWFELIKPFNDLRDKEYRPNLRVSSYTLGEDRVWELEKYIAVALDQFHRDHLLLDDSSRWMDKSPGAEAVQVIPLLANLFPQAQFIFMCRSGVTTIHSAVKLWRDHKFWANEIELFQTMCLAWDETMSAWRRVRDEIQGRYLEVRQEDMACNPDEVATTLTDFLGLPEFSTSISDLLRSNRANSAFPDRSPGDYCYQIDWTDEQKVYFIETCQEEMEAWDYEVDFGSLDSVQGKTSAPDRQLAETGVELRDTRIEELERECQALREHLREVEQGRVMRLLNWIQKWKWRLQSKLSS